MSYSSLETSRSPQFDLANRNGTFSTFQPNRLNGHANNHPNINNNTISSRTSANGGENIYDQIPNEQYYDAPCEMRTNDEVYEPEPTVPSNVITINGISVR